MEAVREWGPIPLILTSFNFSKLLNDSHEKGQHDWSGGWIKSSIFVSIYYVSVYIYLYTEILGFITNNIIFGLVMVCPNFG